MPYSYLIAYMTGRGVGRIDMNRPDPIRDMNDVDEVAQLLRSHLGLSDVQVIGFSRFEDGTR